MGLYPPLASNAKVTVDPNKIFGRHLAVLGNTGSGKSCSVAGLVRWSLEAAKNARGNGNGRANARFIILDPNGEYSTAFKDLIETKEARVYRMPPVSGDIRKLVLPAWMWNSQEWCAFTEASSKVQRPILKRALRELRALDGIHDKGPEVTLCMFLQSYHRSLLNDLQIGAPAYMDKPGKGDFGQKLHAISKDLSEFAKQLPSRAQYLITQSTELRRIADLKFKTFIDHATNKTVEYYNAFNRSEVEAAIKVIAEVLESLPVLPEHMKTNEDTPIPFNVDNLSDSIEQIAIEQKQSQFVDTLLLRVKMLLSDDSMKHVVSPPDSPDMASWLGEFLGEDSGKNGQIAILDLSLVPSDVVHTVVAVTSRIVFEATQRYCRKHTKELPTVLVLEEAHTFVRRGSDDMEGNPTPSQMCRQTFERIAREGRKFGLGLVLSSQRPSELSPTVLAQCNTFLLHRLVNDRDQELVGKLVPDNLGGLLKELPSLPSKQAILLGWAVSVPALVEITELPKEHRPRSSDPKFWEVWTGEEERTINWTDIVEDWVGTRSPTQIEKNEEDWL